MSYSVTLLHIENSENMLGSLLLLDKYQLHT